MSHAQVTPGQFGNLYNRFQKTYTQADGPVIVMYYKINAIVEVYMKFSGICWMTKIEAEDANKFLQMFDQPVQLQSHYD
jgi:hypothetical protein